MDDASDTSGLGARDGLPPMPPGPPHDEKHLGQSRIVRELAEGLLAGAVPPVLVAIVLAQFGAGAPLVLLGVAAVGVGLAVHGAVAAGFDTIARAEHWKRERAQEEYETEAYPERERWEVMALLHRYGVRGDALRLSVDAICSTKQRWVDFMMRYELNLADPEPVRAEALAAGIAGRLFAAFVAALPWLLPLPAGVAALLTLLLGVALFAGASAFRAWTRSMDWQRAAVRGGIAGGVALLAAGLVLLLGVAAG
jgi:Integral membrane protein DUF125.